MRIRCITITLYLLESDFQDNASHVKQKVQEAKRKLDIFSKSLTDHNYTVQTTRISLNCVEEWNPTCDLDIIVLLDSILADNDIQFCSLGGVFTHIKSILAIPYILQKSNRISCSVHLQSNQSKSSAGLAECAPDLAICTAAAEVCLQLADLKGDLGNFSYCVAFNCGPGIPFFPATINDITTSHSDQSSVAIGLENADLIFVSYFGASSLDTGRENFISTLKQSLLPIQHIIEPLANSMNVQYSGIDASLNPGLGQIDSVGAGIEHILEQQLALSRDEHTDDSARHNHIHIHSQSSSVTNGTNINNSNINDNSIHINNDHNNTGHHSNKKVKTEKRVFGSMGTLAAVSSLTHALKTLQIASNDYYQPTNTSRNKGLEVVPKLCGYSGLMLPVMEDLVLAERAAQVIIYMFMFMYNNICIYMCVIFICV